MNESSESCSLIPQTVALTRFEELDGNEHKKILEWRNHPLVSRWMIRQDPIAPSEHMAFVRSLHTDPSKAYFKVALRDEPIGVIDFYQIDPSRKAAYYGYYLRPDRLGSSLGILLEFVVLEFGFADLHLNAVLAETHSSNTTAMRLHQRFGAIEGIINQRGLQESIFHAKAWWRQRLKWSGIVSRLV